MAKRAAYASESRTEYFVTAVKKIKKEGGVDFSTNHEFSYTK